MKIVLKIKFWFCLKRIEKLARLKIAIDYTFLIPVSVFDQQKIDFLIEKEKKNFYLIKEKLNIPNNYLWKKWGKIYKKY